MAQCQELPKEQEEKDLNQDMATLRIQNDTDCPNFPISDPEGLMEQNQLIDEKDAKTCMETDVDLILEAGPNKNFRDCQKNPGHVDFIPVSELTLSHLPEDYHNQTMLEIIICLAELVVCLKVGGSSPDRPLDFPFSGIRYRKLGHSGTGQIIQSDEGEGHCPCDICKTSEEPLEKWYSISIITASHVVFDEIEVKMTKCYLNYDSDTLDLKTCQSLANGVEVIAHKQTDLSQLVFALHDTKMGELLHKKLYNWRLALLAVKQLYYPSETDASLKEQWAELQERCSRLASGWKQVVEKIESVIAGDISQQVEEIRNLDIDTTKSFILIDIVVSKLCDGERGQGWLDRISSEYQKSTDSLHSAIKGSQEIDHEDEVEYRMIYGYSTIIRTKEKQLRWFKNSLGIDCDDQAADSADEPLYDPSHPLTVIISHPHGCGKRITFGKICEKTESVNSLFCGFSYDNPTCPGSSGSRIFILGYNSNSWGLVHSGGSKRQLGQVNKSSVFGNW